MNAYGLSFPTLKVIRDYLQNRKQRTRIGLSCGTWEDITSSGVLQGSILGTLLFNFLYDLFYEYENNFFADYVDDTSPYIVGDNTTEVLANLSSLAWKIFTWLANNKIKANHGKCHLRLRTEESYNIQTANFTIKSSKATNLLGINLDDYLKSDIQVGVFARKQTQKSMLLQK